jgi:hypothetical protein
MWMGCDTNNPFRIFINPVATAGAVTLNYYNMDTGTNHALASKVHTFLVIRQS